ncbi:hypothetical protein HYR99_04015 [Candidatus Poribacteria bacterium]|nr:hypothetical protein [Candidatus Poribacteria bacterium]
MATLRPNHRSGRRLSVAQGDSIATTNPIQTYEAEVPEKSLKIQTADCLKSKQSAFFIAADCFNRTVFLMARPLLIKTNLLLPGVESVFKLAFG